MSQKVKIKNQDATKMLLVKILGKSYQIAPASAIAVTIPANTRCFAEMEGHPADQLDVSVDDVS